MSTSESLLDSVEAPVERAVRTPRWQHVLAQNAPLLLAALILLVTAAVYVVLYARQLDKLPGNFEATSLVNNTLPLVFAAVGQGVVILTRGIDLSVGGMINISNSIAATHMQPTAGSMITWTLVILGVGALGGLLNGVLVAYLRLQPILVTLATLSIFQGVALRVLDEPGGSVPSALSDLLTSTRQPSGILLVALAAVLWFVFRRTRVGTGIVALGNDPAAARANGIPVRRLTVLAYVLSGVMAGAAGLLMAASRSGGDPIAGNVYTLTSIAAVVIGGISFFGGRGSAIGAIFGAFALTLVTNVLFFAQIEPQYTPFYQGLFLVVAVLLGSVAGRLARGRAR